MSVEEHSYQRQLFNRTEMLLGEDALVILRDKTVLIAGCGGVGGATAITLTRLGVGGFVLADPGIFDEPDSNRQWAGSLATLGRNKAEVHGELLRQINPGVRLRVATEGVTEANLESLFEGVDFVLDCLDISVPLTLRSRVYRHAQARGLYCLSAPIFGFGTLVLMAAPGGMGMDRLIEGFVEVATRESKLPPGFRSFFFEPHVDAIERHIHRHKVPSSAIAPVIATGIACAEIAHVFLRDVHPGSREPFCLPHAFAVDPLRGNYRLLHVDALFQRPVPASGVAADREIRRAALEAAGYNVALLPKSAIEHDFSSDSGSEHPLDREALAALLPTAKAEPEAAAAEFYGLAYAFPVSRGRAAEALLASVLVAPGTGVAAHPLFPTTRFALEACGARVEEVALSTRVQAEAPLPSDIDVDALRALLACGNVGLVYLEPCNNALGGQPLSLSNLRAVRAAATTCGALLVLDVSRLVTNAELCRRHDPACRFRSVPDIVREMCGLADAVAGSMTKDFQLAAGGLVGVRDERLAVALRDRIFMSGQQPAAPDRDLMARTFVSSDALAAVARRVDAVHLLHEALQQLGVPLVEPAGGHGVFIDVARLRPELVARGHASDAAASSLYLETGVRAARNLISPAQATRGSATMRLTLRVGEDAAEYTRAVDVLTDAVARWMPAADCFAGLRVVARPDGMLGDFCARYGLDGASGSPAHARVAS